jgi:hypothetical protein
MRTKLVPYLALFFVACANFPLWAQNQVESGPSKPANQALQVKAENTDTAAGKMSIQTNPASIPSQTRTSAATPTVNSVVVFPQAAQIGQKATSGQTSIFVLEIKGKNFGTVDMDKLRIIVFPATDDGMVGVLSRSLDNSTIFAQFSAAANYVLEQVALSFADSSFVTFNTGSASCDFQQNVTVMPQIVSQGQSKTKYGDGVAANFHVIQVSIVNKCPMPIMVPLAGFSIDPTPQAKNPITQSASQTQTAATQPSQTSVQEDVCELADNSPLVPYSLDHVTSIYSADRKLTGKRAIYFNILQAAATLGSAFDPFFAHGFTQGVAILGGAFTTASKEIFVDMSTEQLQNITSQSFGSSEQIASGGSLQKFLFVPRNQKCKKGIVERSLKSGNFSINYELLPASAQAPKTQTAKAKPSASDSSDPSAQTGMAKLGASKASAPPEASK